ncbi:MAG: prephenate dehydrogenase/arogenate dehydrogenase family protein [Clostridia bacterium]|nr:prephenate dehydrogenase/arogenate dehydrogenase family protein [Clostridia bacterium]
MKICVAGLGLIGGSLCMALKRAGYGVDGWNRSRKALAYALENKIADNAAEDFKNYDLVIVALPVEATLKFLNETHFKDGATVADICGVKKTIADAVYAKERNFSYVGCHPMAGKEVSGIENACADLFDRASMIITHDGRTDKTALDLVRRVSKDLGFARIVECSAEVHDKKIAYTSQLAHIVANAYVKDTEIEGCIGFTGGSFQDMTRIAGVDENVWASLYLENAENLSDKIENIITSLQSLKAAIDGKDKQKLSEVLREGRLGFESGKITLPPANVTVTKLK